MTSMPRALRTVLAGVLVGGVLAGCASVPSGGRVVTGRPAEPASKVDDPYVRLIPVSPRSDWGPAQHVAGYLAASASFDDGHKVARQYLAGAANTWNPGGRPAVTVFADRPRLDVVAQSSGRAVVKATASRLGSIGSDGQYLADPADVSVTFQLDHSPAGWRITGLPDPAQRGLLLTKSDVDRAFRTVNLHFFAPGRSNLVPNGIFLPLVNRPNLPAQLVRALLAGPSSWLGPAVETAFPVGTRLRDIGFDNDTLTVDLSKEARTGSPERMSAQLAWTLRQLPEITRWQLRVDGETLTPKGVPSEQPVRSWSANAPDGPGSDQPVTVPTAYVLGASGVLSRLAQDQPQPIDSGGGRLRQPAVTTDHQEVAGLSTAGDQVLAGPLGPQGPQLRTVLTRERAGSRFTAPVFDRDGTMWTVESSRERSRLWMKPRGGAVVRVTGWGLGGREVLAFRPARDGVRVAAIVRVDGRAQVQLGRIVRNKGGGTEAGSFLPISSELVDAIDLSWRDHGTLAALGRKGNDTRVLPYLIPVNGGAISSLGVGALGTPRTITAAPGAPVLIGTETDGSGQVCRQRTPRDPLSEWTCPIPGSDPTYPN